MNVIEVDGQLENRTVRVALAQIESNVGDVQGNWERAVEVLAQASENNAQLVVFPELYLQGYRADELFLDTAVAIPGPMCEEFESAAEEHDLFIVMGLARSEEKLPFCLYNSSVIVGPSFPTQVYDKVHLGTYGKYQEGCYFAPGGSLPVFHTGLGCIGIEICYDISYPEAARSLALRGAEIHIVLSAGPKEFKRTWPRLLAVRSSENCFPTVYVNTVGTQRGVTFFGGSCSVDAEGEIVVQAPYDEEDCTIGEVDLSATLRLRRWRMPFRDRSPEAYYLD